ncbi:MAG TPA: hypothetical protein PKJ08_13445 [Candidatus Cloacimonadota bacterium]|jgi:hypothetical protein|nr:hypothetical protein [Candidatus Cloacimonadota bacterium]HOD55527.1 hypothetical protein [Candidatus Cloacimonadota bacterium]
MLFILLISTFSVGFIVALIVTLFFKKPIAKILKRLIDDDIYESWVKYMIFAIYVVSISSGVNLWKIERYIYPLDKDNPVYEITSSALGFEVYRSAINSLTSLAWLLLVFYIIALITFVIKKLFENRKSE